MPGSRKQKVSAVRDCEPAVQSVIEVWLSILEAQKVRLETADSDEARLFIRTMIRTIELALVDAVERRLTQ